MSTDILQSMGPVALGSRLKRAGVLMQSISQDWLEEQGCEIASTHMPVMLALYREGQASTGELAQMLGIAQPGVSRMVEQLERAGWLKSTCGKTDRRVREIRLSDKGREFAVKANREYWPRIGAAVEAICAELQGDLLSQLSGLETRLGAGEFQARIAEETS